MDASKTLITKVYRHFMHDSLYRNSIFLIASTAVAAISGYIFWIICARLFTSDQVGLATTIISSVALISSFSLMGYNTALIRYINSPSRAERINTIVTLVSLVAAVVSLIFILGTSIFSPKLAFIHHDKWLALLFVIASIITANSTILDSVFVGNRRADLVFMKGTVTGVVKLVLPFALVGLGATGIFLANTFAMFAALLIATSLLHYKFKHIIKPQVSTGIIIEMSRFSFGNYTASFVEGSTALVLPIIIINHLSASMSGYFYIVMMITSALYIIPVAVSQVTFAEGAHDTDSLHSTLVRSIRLIYLALVPAIIAIIALGKTILSAFGKSYVVNGYSLLILLVLASIPVGIKLLANVLFNIENKVGLIIITNAVTVASVLTLSFTLITKGLIGIGVAWLSGETIGTLLAIYLVISRTDTLKSHLYKLKSFDLYSLWQKKPPIS